MGMHARKAPRKVERFALVFVTAEAVARKH
jgi:hypothetical protein